MITLHRHEVESSRLVQHLETNPVLLVETRLLHRHHPADVALREPAEPLRPAGVHHAVLAELDQHQVLQPGQVLLVRGVLDILVVVDVGQPERLAAVCSFVEGVVPVLGLETQ